MALITFHAADEADTERLGRALAEVLPDGAVVGLIGTLGAGKTRLVQAIAVACGIPRESVTSPTFVLCHEYHGDRSLYHFDAYRLRDEDEFLALGVDEIFDREGITLVEWADRVCRAMPDDGWSIHIELGEGTARTFILESPEKAMADSIQAHLKSCLSRKNPPEDGF